MLCKYLSFRILFQCTDITDSNSSSILQSSQLIKLNAGHWSDNLATEQLLLLASEICTVWEEGYFRFFGFLFSCCMLQSEKYGTANVKLYEI